MIRKIVKFRRVSKARERIMSLVTDSVTVQAIVLNNLSTVVGIATDEVLISQEYPDSVEKALLFFLKCLLSKHKFTDSFIHNLYAESPEHLFKLQSNESSNGLQHYQEFPIFSGNLSLFHIINTFVCTLSSEDILALDKALKLGREGYYCLVKNPSNFPKSVNFKNDSVELSDCVHSCEQPEESMEKCNKCVIRNFRSLYPCSRYVVGLTCSQCGSFRSKRTKNNSPSNNCVSKTLFCIDLLLAVCKAWRWKDLSPGDYLRRIGPCQFSEKHANSQICLNPYHWSRILIQDKINEKINCSRYSSDPDIVCLGLNTDSEYPNDMMPLLLPPSALSSLSSSSSSSTESTSAETQISSIQMDQSCDSVISYDPIINNSSSPLLANYNTYAKTKLTYCSPQFLQKIQQKLHMNLINSVSSLTKWKRLKNNTNFTLSTYLAPSKDFNHTTLPPPLPTTTTTTTLTSVSSSDDEMHSCNFILSSNNRRNDNPLQNYNLHFNRLISISDHSVTINNEKSDLHSRLPSPSPLHHLKPWANISYWESHHHVGRRWYQITNRKLNIVYNDVNINDDDDHNNSDVKDKLYSSPKQAYIHKENHSNYSSKSQNDYIYLSLLTLYQSNHVKYNCKSDCNRSSSELLKNHSTTPSITCPTNMISGNNSSIIRSSSKQCKKCYNYVDSFDNTSLIPNLTIHSSMYKSSSGWKQCCRLGSQGISLTLTTYGCVWLSNQAMATNLPIFVSSPCLQFHNANSSSSSSSSLNSSTEDFLVDRPVYRVPAGYSLLVFDLSFYENWLQQHSSSSSSASSSSSCRQYFSNNHNGDNSHLSDNNNNNNNVDFNELHKTHLWAKNNNLCKNPIIHISLGKGWGPSYRRPDVTHCPARLEVWINLEHLFPLFISSNK